MSLSRFVPMWKWLAGFTALVAFAAGAPLPAQSEQALSPEAERGLELVRAACSRCHAIGKTDESPLKAAPPFRVLHLRYPVESLEESLAEGLVTGHPEMPEFRFDPEQVGDVIDYLKMLEH